MLINVTVAEAAILKGIVEARHRALVKENNLLKHTGAKQEDLENHWALIDEVSNIIGKIDQAATGH